MLHYLKVSLVLTAFVAVLIAAPVDKNKKDDKGTNKKNESEELDDFGLEYGRYLQQIVQALEEDKDFAKKLENISAEQLRNGQIAHELEFVKHNVRSRLDELKRIEVDRLRKLVQEQISREDIGLYQDEDGIMPVSEGRRWRTIPGHQGGVEGGFGGGNFWLGAHRKGIKLPKHLDIENPHSFEIDDLKKLIRTATSDLEELDKKRREEFKKYEMEKEYKYRESLKNMTDDEKKETVKHHEELIQKHKDHPKIHHPGSKPQLEQVWEEEDHMLKDEFNPKTFFAMHDINGDGHLDEVEVEAVLMPEVRKMYDSKNEEDDPTEMEEEYHRMREHLFNESDTNKDGLISQEEFLKLAQGQQFEQDEGWKGLDEQTVYSESDFEEYMRQRQLDLQNQYYGDPRTYYDHPNAQNELPPHINYQHPNMPPQHQPMYPQQGYPQQQYQGVPPQQYQGHQGIPPQQYQGGHPQQQQYQGVPPQQHQGVPPQQQYQGVPQQQQYQGVPPQQQYQGVPVQQHQGVPQQPHQGVPQQPHQGVPQQPHQGVPQQPHQGVPQQPHQGVPQQPHQGVPQQPHQGVPQQPHQGVPQQQHQGIPPQQQAYQQQQQQFQGNPPPQQQQQQLNAIPPQENAKPQQAAPQETAAPNPNVQARTVETNQVPTGGESIQKTSQQNPPKV